MCKARLAVRQQAAAVAAKWTSSESETAWINITTS
jgi:hypothetical protein